jgi:hypothetical protein
MIKKICWQKLYTLKCCYKHTEMKYLKNKDRVLFAARVCATKNEPKQNLSGIFKPSIKPNFF